jgi:hypothetical protein
MPCTLVTRSHSNLHLSYYHSQTRYLRHKFHHFRLLGPVVATFVVVPSSSSDLIGPMARSEIHALNVSTIPILARPGSTMSCQPPTERPFIRSSEFLTTIGPQLEVSLCWGVGYNPGSASHQQQNPRFRYSPPRYTRALGRQTPPNITSAVSVHDRKRNSPQQITYQACDLDVY